MGRGPAGIPAPPGLPFYESEGELGGREPLGWRTRCSLPPKPPILPQRAFFGRMERRDDASAFPASTVPREHEEKNLPKPRKETTAYQTAKARRYGGLLLCTAKQAAEKICRLRWHFCRTSGDRKAALPHSPLRRRQAHKAKEGTTRLPILRLRVRAKRVAATEKELATPHESGAAQRLEKGERLPGTCCGHRKTRPLNASHEPFPRAFSV